MYSFLVDDSSEHKNAKGVNKKVVATMNIKMFCWMKNVWDIQWIGFKFPEHELMKSTKFLCLVLMIKYIS